MAKLRAFSSVAFLAFFLVGACGGGSDEAAPTDAGPASGGTSTDGGVTNGQAPDGQVTDGQVADREAPKTCAKTADCQDGNACTGDRCVNGKCEYPRLADGIPCTAAKECSSRGSCQEGVCQLGPAAILLDVKARGAVGDGMADDRQVIQDAIDEAATTGATVYLPTGTYAVTESYNVGLSLASDIAICGDGPDSIIKLMGGTDETRALYGTEVSNVVLRDFTVDGNAAAATIVAYSEQRHTVLINQGDRVLVQRVNVTQSLGDGIFLYGGTHDSVVEGCNATAGVSANPRVGINVQGANHVLIRNNVVDAYETSLKSEIDEGDDDSVGVILTGNTAKGWAPLALNGKPGGRCVDYVIEGNVFEGANDWTLWVSNSTRTTIRYNTFLGGGSGVYLIFSSEDLVVEDNRFEGPSVGVQLSNYEDRGASVGVSIQRNEFVDVDTAVNVSAPITDVEVANNRYPAEATLIARPELVTNLSEHDNTPVP